MARLNVQNYGAAGDGSTDDTAAIQSAIDDATAGDTVFFPEPAEYYAVYGSQVLMLIDGTVHADNLTLEGEGEASEIRYAGGNGGSNMFVFRIRHGPSGLEIRDLNVNGAHWNISGSPNAVHCFNCIQPDTGNQSVHFEDVRMANAYSTGLSLSMHGVTATRCTFSNSGGHGASIGDPSNVDTGSQVEFRQCLFENNSSIAGGHYGIDTAQGNFLLEDCVIANNGAAMKTAGPTDGTIRRVRITGNDGHSFLSTTSGDTSRGTVRFEDVVITDNGDSMRLEDQHNFVVPNDSELVVSNSSLGRGQPQIWLIDNATLDASTIYSNRAGDGEPGFESFSAGVGSVISNYYHYNNSGGPTGATDNVSIGSMTERDKTDIDAVPTAGEVGAWSDGSGSDPDPPEPPEPEPTTAIAAAGGAVQAAGGVLATGAVPVTSAEVVDDFEGYAPGTTLADTDPWAGAGSLSANYRVVDTVSAGGAQAVELSGSNSYNAIQSTGGLDWYPAADCTIRVASYVGAGSHDIAFGVPGDETNFHENCYRLRGGPLLDRTPELIRTVNGEMVTLASLDSYFPTDTWLEHAIEFEATGSEVVLTYHGYAWDDAAGEWNTFATGVQGVDSDNAFPAESGVGFGTYQVEDDVILFDEYRVAALGETGPPGWTPGSMP